MNNISDIYHVNKILKTKSPPWH